MKFLIYVFILTSAVTSSYSHAQGADEDILDHDLLAFSSSYLYHQCDSKKLGLKGFALVTMSIKEEFIDGQLPESEAMERMIGVWKTKVDLVRDEGMCNDSTSVIEYLAKTIPVMDDSYKRTIDTFERFIPK